MAFSRFRVRKSGHTFQDRGPDLLRPRANARQRVRAIMAERTQAWSFRTVLADGSHTAESTPLSRHAVLVRYDEWAAKPGRARDFVLLHRGDAQIVVRHERVRRLALENTSPATIVLHSLIAHQFPKLKMAGAYLFRQISGSSDWSDHAWGTAIDESAAGVGNEVETNAETTDWLSRMGKSRCCSFDYALGCSRGGQVVSVAAPDYDIEPSGAAASHKWHAHISETDHDGRRPPRSGGVW